MGKIPNGWLDYTPMGKRIEGTRFIAFKVPLMGADLRAVPENNRLDPELLLEYAPDLGLIIDLTDTARYYKAGWFVKRGLEHQKIAIRGHVLPPTERHKRFAEAVDDFIARNADNDKLIGVHCTHGCNRTGLMICMYLVRQGVFTPQQALDAFQTSRGHDIHRDAYIAAIRRCRPNSEFSSQSPSPPPPTFQSLVPPPSFLGPIRTTGSHGGFDPSQPPPPLRMQMPPPRLLLDWQRCGPTQRPLATITVQPGHLIPDGHGAFYIRVQSNGPLPLDNAAGLPMAGAAMLLHPLPSPLSAAASSPEAHQFPVPPVSWLRGNNATNFTAVAAASTATAALTAATGSPSGMFGRKRTARTARSGGHAAEPQTYNASAFKKFRRVQQ